MQRFQKLVKICLIAAIISGCDKAPEFPEWNPLSVVQSKNKAFKCKLVDKELFQFVCEQEAIEFTSLPDGQFCTSPEETKGIINWVKETKKYLDKQVNKNGT